MFTTLSPVAALAQLHIDIRTPSPTTVCFVVIGEVDLATAGVLRARLLGVLHDQAPEVIDVDLAGVRYLDCAGLGALAAAHIAATHTECLLWVTHPQPIVHRILQLTGLLDLLTAPNDQPPRQPVRSGYRPGHAPPAPRPSHSHPTG